MSKFKYLIVDTIEAVITGTNSTNLALELAENEENFVINVAKDFYLQANGDEDSIEQDMRDPSS